MKSSTVTALLVLFSLFAAGCAAGAAPSEGQCCKTDTAKVIQIPGPAGPSGADGPMGIAGSPGEKGDTGAQGVPGVRGNTGSPGPRGEQGIQGVAGPAGPVGVGQTGARGAAGTNGVLSGKAGLYSVQVTVNAAPGDADVVAPCKNKKDILLNGGCLLEGNFPTYTLSAPSNADAATAVSGWECGVGSDSSNGWTLTAYATCIAVP